MNKPTQIVIPLSDWNELIALVLWYASMPEGVGELTGDKFHEHINDKKTELVGYEDETDSYYVADIEADNGKLFAVMVDNNANGDEEFLVPVVADADLA